METQNQASQDALTPAAALDRLKEGNARFVGGAMASRDLPGQVQATSGGQWPFAAILGCIDSRVAPEVVFDQGVGDVFSARVAGNFVNEDILGSLEFACAVAGSKLIVVLGHSSCGAVKGACDGVELGNLTAMLSRIQPSVAAVAEPAEAGERTSKNAAFVQAVADENVRRTVAAMRAQSPVLAELERDGKIMIIGAMYDVASGKVTFDEGSSHA